MDDRPSSRTRAGVALRVLAGLVALAFVFGPACAGILGVREKPIENRALAPAPDLHDGFDAADAVGPWAIDRLPGRSEAIDLKARLDYYYGGDLPGTPVAQPVGAAGAAAQPGGVGTLSPTVIRGEDGYLFLGADFIRACKQAATFDRALADLLELARTIEKSGRRVVVTVAPNKSSVVSEALPRAVPRGSCALDGIRAENRSLDAVRDPLWAPVRDQLVTLDRSGRDAYWRTDTHWTSLGGEIWIRQLLDRLAPGSAGFPTARSSERKVGDLMALIGLKLQETADAVSISSGAAATDTGTVAGDVGQRWTSAPSRGLVPGRTLFVGDSFTDVLLSSIKPLVAEGAFAPIGASGAIRRADLVDEIAASDTVVLEVAQRNLVGSVVADPKLRAAVARRLAADR